MNEHPIIFSAPMVRAILEGRKTQTRRVVKPSAGLDVYLQDDYGYRYQASYKPGKEPLVNITPGRPHTEIVLPHCPYGQPGDRLWVRESWQYANWTEEGEPYIRYAADGAQELFDVGRIPDGWFDRLEDIWAGLSTPENYAIDNRAADRRWRPSIHMPRWASRITLEVTDVRVERLQDISEADGRAEGLGDTVERAQHWYRELWMQINGAESWDANPWVWVVSFSRA